MKRLPELFNKNAEWAKQISANDPDFFSRLSKQQNPEYFWIGCADSRVPANQIVGLDPGELFVHRNVANLVNHADLNCLSALQYAVENLKVKHVIVCGHYGCGGVAAALENQELGLITNWLRHIQDVAFEQKPKLDKIENHQEKCDILCEMNVVRQVLNTCRTTIIQDAWKRQQEIAVHGWIYSLKDGRLKDLGLCIQNNDELDMNLHG